MFSSALDRSLGKTHVLNMFNSTRDSDRYARAIGRIVFGTVMLVGAAIVVQRSVTMAHPQVGKVIAATWLVAVFCGWSIRHVSVIWTEGKPVDDIFTLSYAVPTTGVALLMPLSLHLVVASAIGETAAGFDTWAKLGLIVAGTAHIAFAICTTSRAVALAQGRIATSTRQIFVYTLVVSAIPFGLLLMIPPLVVGLTGLVMLPVIDYMPTMIERERGPAHPLPQAIVV
jgi:hypothetical protein